MLTARGGVEDRIAGLDEGADDYLVKPFALGELLARMRALLRRESGATGAVIQWQDLVLDGARHEVRNGVTPVELNPKEYALLRWFLLHPERSPQRGAPARARMGRARRPVHEHRAGDAEQPAPQARGRRSDRRDRDVAWPRLPASGRGMTARRRGTLRWRLALGMTALALATAALVGLAGFLLGGWLGYKPEPVTVTRVEQIGDRVALVQITSRGLDRGRRPGAA